MSLEKKTKSMNAAKLGVIVRMAIETISITDTVLLNRIRIKRRDNKYGVIFGHIKSREKVTFNVAYNKGNPFMAFKTTRAFFNIHQCDFGIMVYDSVYTDEDLNKLDRSFEVDYGILFVLKVASNRLSLRTLSYNSRRIRASVCPYTNWAPKGRIIKFIPAPYVENNGFFENSNGKAHIILPVFRRDDDYNFFSCGKVVQPTLPDLSLGFSLVTSGSNYNFKGDITALDNDIVCDNHNDINKLYHFGLLEKDSNYMGITKVDKIDVTLINRYKLYSDQIIMIYNKEHLIKMVKHGNNFIKLGTKDISVDPLCIAKLNSNISATLLPTMNDLESLYYSEDLDIFYSTVKGVDLNKKIPLKCLSKVKKDTYRRYDEFYSQAALISVIKSDDKTYTTSPIINETQFTTNLEGFGSYFCRASMKTKAYRENVIKIKKMYFIPDDKFKFDFSDVVLDNKIDSYVGCINSYNIWGYLKDINISSQDQSPISVKDIKVTNKDIIIKDNFVYFKKKYNLTKATVYCNYETVFKTMFTTKQNFKFPQIVNPIENLKTTAPPKTNLTLLNISMLSGIIFIILFAVCIIVITIIIMKRKKRRSKAKKRKRGLIENSLMPSSSLSTGSKLPKLKVKKKKVSKVAKSNYISTSSNSDVTSLSTSKTVNQIKLIIRVSVCPYINWVPKGGMIEYIPDPFVKDNGFFEESNDKTHIILPMFKRGNDEDFFTCGKVIQPTLPDLTIGCYLKDVKKGKPFDSNITALKNELVCNNGKYTNINKLYHFGFMERDSNYMNITKMDKIDASLTNHYKLFSEQIIMMYDKEKINTMVKSKNKFFKIKSKGISEVPLCIAGLNNDINAVLIPTTSSLDSVSYNENLDSYYSFVSEKDMGINMPLKCLSKVENDTYNRYDEFYSKAAVLSVIKSENITNSSSPIIDKTQFTNKIEGFGSYMCQVSNKTKAYREDFIKIKKMYFIPVDNLLVDFQDVVINNKTDSYVHCNKSYETWGNLNTMYIYSQEQSFMTMHVFKYPSENATIKDNIVYIKNKSYQKTLEVYCTYETIFNSVFLTKRNFKFPNLIVPIRKPEVTTSLHDENKMDGLKVIRICGVLFIVLILLCTILTIIIIKKNRKRKERNYLKSCSTLTKKSKSKSKIKNLFKSKSIINRSFSTSSNRPFLKNSKNKQKKI
uniref:Ig-like domain-containing protein n=1 Tax=Parastrongyloides trichosuri TaxID=131310 RepID=A0A0N4ZM60_PARTI